jgi:hypothetical protein
MSMYPEFQMSGLLIRDIDPDLKDQIEQRARVERRSLSDQAKHLIRIGLRNSVTADNEDRRGLGTLMMELVRPEDRGEDLVFEVSGELSQYQRL